MKKNILVVVLVFAVLVVVFLLVGNKDKKENPLLTPTPGGTLTSGNKEENQNMEELKIEDIVIGTGKEATSGSMVTVNYLGTLVSGEKFDSSYDRGEPFVFNLGQGEVIKGWDMGVSGMKEGGKRKLTIPSDLAYGDRGAGGLIGPGATLVFEVELLTVE